jgi:hypothetical protein
MHDILPSLRMLSDADLVARLKSLAARERHATAELVAHIAELDSRDIHFQQGYGSLFAYCRDALSLSEHEAYNRIEVARAARRFPLSLEMLAEGAINLTSVRLLAPHLTPENHRSVLASASGKRKVQVEEIAARLAPVPDVPLKVRKLPVSLKAWPASSPAHDSSPIAPSSGGAPPVESFPPPPTRSVPIVPLAPERYKLQVTIGSETLQKLHLAKDMLRHALPTGDDAAILDRALTALLDELARRKFGASDQPRPNRGTAPGSRHIPAEVRRTVWLRDLGCCAFVGQSGRRCGERAFVEFHHVRPFAVGGEATAANIQLRCRRHNDYEARAYFGTGDSFRNESPVPRMKARDEVG